MALSRYYWFAAGYCWPAFSVADFCNQAGRKTRDNSKRVGWDSLCKQAANIDNPLAGQFAYGVPLPAQIDQPGFPLMLRIPRQANPLKVLWTVVHLVAVNVVDGQPLRVSINKRESDEPVQGVLNPSAPLHRGDFKVAISRLVWLQSAFRERRHHGLLLAPPNPLANAFVRWRFNFPCGTNKPAKTLRLNLFPNFHCSLLRGLIA